MGQAVKSEKAEIAVALANRAAAIFIGRAKKGATDNLLLERHYFCLDLAEPPFALVVMGIRGKTGYIRGGVSR